MKKFLLVTAFLVTASIAFAQDKYEFMSIAYETTKSSLFISVNGESTVKEKVELPKEDNSPYNTNPLLSKVKEYQGKGWEVMNYETYHAGVGPAHMAYLRKKKS